ncbi:MAG: methyltransferase domain-containing protein [Sorangiineae bacterium]|nr:methyltransferase domain-containing protein [Polyangiaceae bacterium]MEB2322725.1 methyltransferase domain-containing protein [Sorangiineae bacterium]
MPTTSSHPRSSSTGTPSFTAPARAGRLAYFEGSLPLRWFEGERLRAIRELVAEDPGHRILQIGSGAGHVARMFRHSHVVVVDSHPELLELARRNLKDHDVELVQGDLESLRFSPRSFDRVICTQVLEHLEHPERVLERIAELVKPGGRAIVTVANAPLSRGVKRVLTSPPLGWVFDTELLGAAGERLHQWTPDEFRRLVSSRFHVEEQRALPFAWLPLRVCYLCRVRRTEPLAHGRVES